jgi:protein TonB
MMGIRLARFGPVAASVLVHVGIAGMVVLAPGTPARPPILFAELVEPDPPLPAAPAIVDRRPLRLPKPIETPMPAAPAPARPREPEIPAPEPVPLAAAQAAPVPTAPLAPAVEAAPSSSTPSGPPVVSGPPAPGVVHAGSGAFAVAPPSDAPASGPASAPTAAAQPAGPAVAALPSDGVTQRAIPQGGYQHRPAYPSSARRLGVQGTTLLNVLVADDGRVANVIVTQSAGHPDLDQAAADAVRRWRFEPARRGTEKVAMWVQLPVEFRLR